MDRPHNGIEPVNLNLPLELDTGERVLLKQTDPDFYYVELLEDQRWQAGGMRKGVTVAVSYKTNIVQGVSPRYIRNSKMPHTNFFVGQRVLYQDYCEGTILSIDLAADRIHVKMDDRNYNPRQFTLEGKGIGPASSGKITPVGFAKRSGFVLVSTTRGQSRFQPTLEEASRDYHESDGTFVICTCEQQTFTQGGQFQIVNIGGPVAPLPKGPTIEIHWYEMKPGSLNKSIWTSSMPNKPNLSENLKLTFSDGKLTGAEVVS